MQNFIVLDGNSLLHRAFHATPPMSTRDGIPTNCLYGFASVLITILEIERPVYGAVCFDTRVPTFRKQKLESYKAGRVKPPDEFYTQIPLVHDFLKALALPVFTCDGFEADDLLATLAHRAAPVESVRTILITSDRDAHQLVTERCHVHDLGGGYRMGTLYDPAQIYVKYGLTPDQIVDYKALVGDTSDNLPGVKGIGPKTASKLLQDYKTLDNLYAHLSEIKTSVREKLEAHKSDAYLTQEMARLHHDAPCDFNLESARLTLQLDTAATYLATYQIHGLDSRLHRLGQPAAPEAAALSSEENALLDQLSIKPAKPKPKKAPHDDQLSLF